jgi:hypothetical protein
VEGRRFAPRGHAAAQRAHSATMRGRHAASAASRHGRRRSTCSTRRGQQRPAAPRRERAPARPAGGGFARRTRRSAMRGASARRSR